MHSKKQRPAPRAGIPANPSPAAAPCARLPCALQVFATLHAGCLFHIATDDGGAPHVRAGEIAIVDPADREPRAGELFLVTYGSPERPGARRRTIVEVWPRQHCNEAGTFIGWWSGPVIRPRSAAEAAECFAGLKAGGRVVETADGPRTAEHLREALVGRVIGILRTASASAAA